MQGNVIEKRLITFAYEKVPSVASVASYSNAILKIQKLCIGISKSVFVLVTYW